MKRSSSGRFLLHYYAFVLQLSLADLSGRSGRGLYGSLLAPRGGINAAIGEPDAALITILSRRRTASRNGDRFS